VPEATGSRGIHLRKQQSWWDCKLGEISVRVRFIAFYLPQFHPIPENDRWWGTGFTEWTNVAKAKPLFAGHYQPHIPADLGFYDLRLPKTRLAQAELAREHAIEGFCYWHYWFCGRRLLEQPFNEILESGQPNFPFCLAWANETWSRRWLGEEKDILQEQTYSAEDDLNHARWLLRVFADKRCIRVQGRPLFLIYRPLHLPDPRRTTDTLREEVVKSGLPEPFLLGINAHCSHLDCRTVGFDGTLNFEPQLGVLPDAFNDLPSPAKFIRKFIRNQRLGISDPTLKIYEYSSARQLMLAHKRDFPTYPSIFVGWDSTPRRGRNGIVIIKSEPEYFADGLRQMIISVENRPYEDRLVFINAWNEWAEGNHIEPDLKHGLRYLEAVKLLNVSNVNGR
jgi:Glycosyltransferase WbsX